MIGPSHGGLLRRLLSDLGMLLSDHGPPQPKSSAASRTKLKKQESSVHTTPHTRRIRVCMHVLNVCMYSMYVRHVRARCLHSDDVPGPFSSARSPLCARKPNRQPHPPLVFDVGLFRPYHFTPLRHGTGIYQARHSQASSVTTSSAPCPNPNRIASVLHKLGNEFQAKLATNDGVDNDEKKCHGVR